MEEVSRRKFEAKVWNDRIKSIASVLQGFVLILAGAGVFRFFLDPDAPEVEPSQIASATLIGLALFVLIGYILGLQRPED